MGTPSDPRGETDGSDTDPGGWWEGPDGRWYPPDAALAARLRRGPGGSVILDDLPEERDDAAPERGVESIGGPIRPTPTVYFGRPPGTENRRAGVAALVAAALLLLAFVAPWAIRDPAIGQGSLGWRDANGALGPAWTAGVLAVGALVAALASMAGRTDRWLRLTDLAVGAVALAVATVESIRILQARALVEDLTGGRIELQPTWGPGLVAAAGLAMVAAAAVHRSSPPAWRRT